MTCFTVKNESGENDPRFVSLVNIHDGDENKALNQYVREYVLKESRTDFQIISDQYSDVNDFIDGSFQVNDKFTDMEANNIRSNKDFVYRKVFKKGNFVGEMSDAYGKIREFDLNDLDKEVEKLIKEKKELSGGIMKKIKEVLGLGNIGQKDDFTKSLHAVFKRMNPDIVYSLIRGLNVDKITEYSNLASKPFYIKSLENENIMIHENTVNEVKEYTIIMPTTDRAEKGFNDSEKFSFMRKVFGDHKVAQKKGFTVKDSIHGRKQIIGSMVAMAIKASDSEAKINGVRFVSLAGKGDTFDLDLYEGVRNVKAMASNPETNKLLPKELLDLMDDSSGLEDASFMPVYTDLLFGSLHKRKEEGKPYSYHLYDVLKDKDPHAMLEAIDNRINFMVKAYGEKDSDGIKKYEKFNTEIGKEMILLSRSKEQLMQHARLDKRAYNSNSMLTWFDSWRKSMGDMQNAQMNMLFNQYKSVMFGVKQRFDKFVKEKNTHVKEFMDAYEKDKGTSVKSRALNYTQDAYKNLFETMMVRKLEDGKVSDEKVEIQIMKFKDPNNKTNGLKDYERKFIRESVAIHKKSILRFIKKKIQIGEIKGFNTAEDWYKQEYESNELNLPAMKKSSSNLIAEGSVKNAVGTMVSETYDFLEITPAGHQKERSTRPYGSASAQLGGIFGEHGRIRNMGLESYNEEIVVSNPKRNKSLNLDVEQILHSSVLQNFKFEHEIELVSTHTAARIILLADQENGRDRKTEVDTIDTMFANMLYNEKVDISQGEVDWESKLNFARQISSTVTLAVNWKSALLATIGNAMTLTTNALSSRFGPMFFNGKDIGKAVLFSGKNPKMFGDIIDMFLFHERNESTLVFSDKFKEGERGFIKSRHLMLMHSLGDRYTRGLILVGQLVHEGLLDNFVYDKSGTLTYDWSKDKRSTKIKDEIRERNRRQDKDDIPYDDHQINTLTSIAAKIYGAYTDEDRTRISTHAGAQFFSQFKGYLIARANEFYQTGFENTNISWYTTDENGEVKATTYYQEGILNTLNLFRKEVFKLKKSPITSFHELKPEQQQNLKKLAADLAFFGSFAFLWGALSWDDEDDELGKKIRSSNSFMYFKFAWLDIVGIYNLGDYVMFFSPASITFMEKYVYALTDILTFDFEDGLDKAWTATGIGKSGNDVFNMLNEMNN